jgi:hypothetical protein
MEELPTPLLNWIIALAPLSDEREMLLFETEELLP